jgi:hypothetical protein
LNTESSVEQRLVEALRSTEWAEPSLDLWARVVHSIDEDRAHRRRVATSFASTIVIVIALVVIALLNVIDTSSGRQVRIPAMELIETVALVALVIVLGPAIRRFGRGYAHDLWPATPGMAASLLRMFDIAYALVFGGYIMLTTHFDFGRSTITVAKQTQDLCWRVGGLVLTMGLLHAATIMMLPVIALVSNSTRVGRKLPRWVVVILVLLGVGLALFGVQAVGGGIDSAV